MSETPAGMAIGTGLMAWVRAASMMSRDQSGLHVRPVGLGQDDVREAPERPGKIRLSFDVIMWEREIQTVPLYHELRDEIEAELQARMLKLVAAGRDVVLDFSFWSRRMRDDYRDLLGPMGVDPETVYLAADRATVLERMRARRGSHCDDFVLGDELAAKHFDHFESPTAEEGPLTIVSG